MVKLVKGLKEWYSNMKKINRAYDETRSGINNFLEKSIDPKKDVDIVPQAVYLKQDYMGKIDELNNKLEKMNLWGPLKNDEKIENGIEDLKGMVDEFKADLEKLISDKKIQNAMPGKMAQ